MSYDNEQKEMAEILVDKAKIKIFLLEGKSILATAQVTFGGILEVNGFTIKTSQYNDLWIQPPTYGQKYYKSFFIKDKKLYKNLLDEIERAYKNELDILGTNEAIEDMKF